MDRREFIKTATTLLVSAAVPGKEFAHASGSENQGRLVLPINRG
jgi:hypothetical protein